MITTYRLDRQCTAHQIAAAYRQVPRSLVRGEDLLGVEIALRLGWRGFPGGQSLADLV